MSNILQNSNGISSAVGQFDQTLRPGSSQNLASRPTASQADATQSWIGRTIDRYTIEKFLGGGGMGQVYLARHRWLDMPVAIKLLNSGLDQDTDAIDRFRREARLAATLDHPNIVRATDGGSVEGSFYLVTEYIEGVDLKSLIAARGPLKPEQACWIVIEVAKALQHAHQIGMVHRDIKPANIMLTGDGRIKLLDLGLARHAESNTKLTATGQFMGTIDYVSPEQAVDTRRVDHRSDIYSLGCTFYHLLTGRAPFEGSAYDSIVSKILAHTEESPQPISTFRKNVAKPIVQALDRMMAKSPADRFQSALEIEQALEKHAEPVFGNGQKDQGAKTGAKKNSALDDWLDNAVEQTGRALWICLRTLLQMTGFIERVEINSNSRLGGPKQYRSKFSFKGVIVLAVFLFFVLPFFLGGIVIEEVPYE